jgi:tetratricopeptide (TPR) repeat protein
MRIGLYCLLLVVVAAPLAVGGVRTDVQLALALMASFSIIMIALASGHRDAQVTPIAWIPMGVAGFVLLQLVPMPISWLTVCSPETASLYLEVDPTIEWAPLTVDFVSTASSAIHQLVFAAVLLSLLLTGAEHKRAIAWCIVLCGFSASLIAIGHSILDAQKIYGVYDALHRNVMTGFYGPFVNENTFASLLVLSAFLAIGIALEGGNGRQVKCAVIASVTCLVSVFLTASRGGHVAALIGCATLGALNMIIPAGHNVGLFGRMKVMTSCLALGLLAAMASIIGLFSAWKGLSISTLLDEPKFETWSRLGPYLDKFGDFGTGRGTFGHVFPQVQSLPTNGTVSHAENFIVQTLTEFGFLVGIMVGLAYLLMWVVGVARFRRRPRALTAGALAGLTAVGCQQLVDFGLESMGLSLAVAATLAVIFCERSRRQQSGRLPYPLLGIVILIMSIIGIWGREIVDARGDGHLKQIREATSINAIEAAGVALALRHPADAMIPLLVAGSLSQQNEIPTHRVLHWSNLAQKRAPLNSTTHEITALALMHAGFKDQAAGEYRRAILKAPWRALALTKTVARYFSKPQQLLAAIPNTAVARQRIYETLFQKGQHKIIRGMTDQELLLNPNSEQSRLIQARLCLKMADRPCLDKQMEWFRKNGSVTLAFAIQARQSLLDKDTKGAEHALNDGLANGGTENEIFLRQAIKTYGILGRFERARTCLDHLWRLSRLDAGRAFEVLVLRGWLEQKAKRYESALEAYNRALTLKSRPDVVIKASRMEGYLGQHRSALKRIKDALEKAPNNGLLRALHKRLERARSSKKAGSN